MTPGNTDRMTAAEAIISRDMETAWRQWRAYITELQQTRQQATASGDTDESLLEAVATAVPKARLPAEVRRTYADIVEQRRQQMQAEYERDARTAGKPLPDADAVYDSLLQTMQRELNGEAHASGYAIMWYQGSWIRFDATTVATTLRDVDYTQDGDRRSPTRVQMIGAAVGVLILGVVFWQFLGPFFFGSPAVAPMTAGGARIGVDTVPAWPLTSAAIGDRVVTAALRGSYPATLCVPGDARDVVRPGATVTITSTNGVRRYQVQSSVDDSPDLAVATCRDQADPPLATALLVTVETRTFLPSDVVTVVQVRGSDVAPDDIPATQMEVVMQVPDQDVTGAVLVLTDGTRWAPSRTDRTAAGVQQAFLVPAARTAQSAGWEVPQDTAPPLLAPVTIPAPLPRAAILQRDLLVSATQARRRMDTDGPVVDIDLQLQFRVGAPVLTLMPDDVVAMADGVPVRVRWTPPIVGTDQPVSTTITLPLRDVRAALTVTLATWNVQVPLAQ